MWMVPTLPSLDLPRLGPSDLKDTDARAQVVGMPVLRLCPLPLEGCKHNCFKS